MSQAGLFEVYLTLLAIDLLEYWPQILTNTAFQKKKKKGCSTYTGWTRLRSGIRNIVYLVKQRIPVQDRNGSPMCAQRTLLWKPRSMKGLTPRPGSGFWMRRQGVFLAGPSWQGEAGLQTKGGGKVRLARAHQWRATELFLSSGHL